MNIIILKIFEIIIASFKLKNKKNNLLIDKPKDKNYFKIFFFILN